MNVYRSELLFMYHDDVCDVKLSLRRIQNFVICILIIIDRSDEQEAQSRINGVF